MSHEFDKAAALAWIRKSLTVNHRKYPPFVLGDFEAQVVNKFKALGVDVSHRQLALDYDGVRHTYVKHGNKLVEAARHQRAIVAADIAYSMDSFMKTKKPYCCMHISEDTPQLTSKTSYGEIHFNRK
ncbi:MAG: hypothetical protein QM533_07005 [Cytophagales bacterium]|nr:hypothetical protein [Cytophagales bacterium]